MQYMLLKFYKHLVRAIEDCDRSSFATRMSLVNKPKNILILVPADSRNENSRSFVLLLFQTLMHRCNDL